MREQDPGRNGDDFQGAFLDASVAAVVLGVGDGDIRPGQPGELFAQGGLVILHGEQIMRAALFDKVFRVVFLAVQGVCRDQCSEQVDGVQKC